MATKQSSSNFIKKNPKSRPGRHSKLKSSTNKNSKFYQKPYKGQGK